MSELSVVIDPHPPFIYAIIPSPHSSPSVWDGVNENYKTQSTANRTANFRLDNEHFLLLHSFPMDWILPTLVFLRILSNFIQFCLFVRVRVHIVFVLSLVHCRSPCVRALCFVLFTLFLLSTVAQLQYFQKFS